MLGATLSHQRLFEFLPMFLFFTFFWKYLPHKLYVLRPSNMHLDSRLMSTIMILMVPCMDWRLMKGFSIGYTL